uniref:ribosomal protein S18-alanine N-acetyltransferase n=1 Tax=Altererythrobacter segetis TaxID=1104773 RepID=UPI001FAF27E2|nr:ribosomal protein S18-alanine N-acetyltransferase [Altererythrobacter segetis]
MIEEQIDDLDRIMAVMQVAFDPAFGEAWNRRQVSDALILPSTHYVLAGPDGDEPADGATAVGFALSRGVLDEEELLLIAVDPAYRGRGIGAALLQRFIETAEARGKARLFLEMREGNPADSLYRRAGFEPIGRRRNYYRRASKGPLDAITYLRSKSDLSVLEK